uniref:Uncharacterized protein n=1 Tax=Chromera velia CCMP2878 TaxID=1169474 RepID=A0A0G4I9J1_9ALVE|eukprot:Cvel_12257.t1-p1 / transcript=Cvel_12257.t1 / gene=Cvel_12257 / organism=Chromera_velia_CCMP2878 / gene_product=hypothetical protein / transcript_product=hypothetical protein / location=Cvel_scaffold793:59313-62096(+) / protein_length=122 / sequence_SO=supercontig / SO=protein_coding / is_pseudo=false
MSHDFSRGAPDPHPSGPPGAGPWRRTSLKEASRGQKNTPQDAPHFLLPSPEFLVRIREEMTQIVRKFLLTKDEAEGKKTVVTIATQSPRMLCRDPCLRDGLRNGESTDFSRSYLKGRLRTHS